MEKLPEKILSVEYAGFFDFNTDGMYGPSLINMADNKYAKEISEEISRRYNLHNELIEALTRITNCNDLATAQEYAKKTLTNILSQQLDQAFLKIKKL